MWKIKQFRYWIWLGIKDLEKWRKMLKNLRLINMRVLDNGKNINVRNVGLK